MRSTGQDRVPKAVILALVVAGLMAGCSQIDDLLQPDPAGFITLVANVTSLPADGQSRAQITVHVDNRSILNYVASFATSAGGFIDGATGRLGTTDVPVDLNGYATVELASDAVLGGAIVSATVEELTRTVRIDFRRAYPDHITLSLDLFSLRALFGRQIRLTIQLSRSLGTVTPGLLVDLKATTEAGDPIGTFESTTLSDDLGAVTSAFTVGDSLYRGDVTLEVSVLNPDNGQRVVARSIIEVVD